MTLAWHFASTKMRDGRELGAPGDVEEWDGPVVLCESGLHASERILDALSYAPGTLLRRVEITGQCEHDKDKLAGQRRRILWECDMTAALRLFARQCALDVRHLWDMPDVMFEYLMTGDERIRSAARAVARAAADAARDAALDAARAVARAAADAARDAALDAAWAAAWSAADAADAARDAADAALAAALDAAWAAAWSAADAAAAAWDAARDAARAAALAAARAAAQDAIREKQEERLVAYANAARCGLFTGCGR